MPLQGEEGKTLFPSAGPPSVSPQAYMEHAFVLADSEEVLAAHASAWNLGAGFSTRTTHRYASYRAVQVTDVHEIDDTSPIREPPSNAIYYPWKVYMGHSYEVLIEGEASQFHAGVQADLFAASARIDDFVNKHHLLHHSVGYGLRPATGKAIFARTQEQIRDHYVAETDRPVPILVEWREIPGRKGRGEQIVWTQLEKGCPGRKGCEPCEEWEFDYIEWQLPQQDRNGEKWDRVNGLPDAVLTLTINGQSWPSPEREVYLYKWKMPPKRIRPGTNVHLTAVDKDGTDEEFMGSVRVKIQEYHEDQGIGGKVVFENGSAFMTGRCIRP